MSKALMVKISDTREPSPPSPPLKSPPLRCHTEGPQSPSRQRLHAERVPEPADSQHLHTSPASSFKKQDAPTTHVHPLHLAPKAHTEPAPHSPRWEHLRALHDRGLKML